MSFVKFDPYKKRESGCTHATSATPATLPQNPCAVTDFDSCTSCDQLATICDSSGSGREKSQRSQTVASRTTPTKALASNAFLGKVAAVAEVAVVPSESEFLVPQESRETFDLADFEERAAILEHEAGLTRQEAETVAAVELGHDDDASFYAAQIATWRREIEALPHPNMKEGAALVNTSLDFLASEWALKAVAAGWDENSLFGVFDGPWTAIRSRYDAQGLIPGIALSALRLTLAEINEHAAILTSRTGSRLRHPRDLPGGRF